MQLERNFLLEADSYKLSHFEQYPPGTENVHSYVEARQGGEFDETLFFGLQFFLQDLAGVQITPELAREAESFALAHGEPFNREGVDHIINKHGGRLPIVVKAVPEGHVIPCGNVLATVETTDPAVPWLTSYVETELLRAIWYPATVATVSFRIKKIIKDYLELTSDNAEAALPFKLHDFGNRGVSSRESAMIGGAAHLVNFMGTDTMVGIRGAMQAYLSGMCGYSIPAAEHSTITSWGSDREIDAYRNMIQKFGGEGKIYAVVSDSYDLDNAVNEIWGKTLKDEVIQKGGTLVIRPDSGDPVFTPVRVLKNLTEILSAHCTTNSKGYIVLPDWVRVIQGDGVNENSIREILSILTMHGISAENIAFGMGGALLQQVNRDTARFAQKASAIQIDGEWHNVQKQPKTDMSKASKAGRLALIRDSGIWQTVPLEGNHWRNELNEVFKNGEIRGTHLFDQIRGRAALYL